MIVPEEQSPSVSEWWRGALDIPGLAARLGDELASESDFFEDEGTPVEQFDWWWTSLSDELALSGFSAEDFAQLLDSFAPSVPNRLLLPAPVVVDIPVPDRRRPTVRVYVDIDGVFSPYCFRSDFEVWLPYMRDIAVAVAGPPATGWTWLMTSLGFGPTPLPLELGAALVDLDCAGDVEVVWLTSWHDNAPMVLEALGIDHQLRGTRLDDWRGVEHSKWTVVRSEVERDGIPFVWIDDLEITPAVHRWASTLETSSLLVATNRFHGLTPTTWERVVRWAAG